jgi:hypothetical protein
VAPVTGPAAATDDKTTDAGKAVAPQARYLIITGAVIVAGGFAGTLIHDHWARAVSFVPPQGIGIFALFYIIAQVIERVQEPFVPYLGLAKDPGEERREEQEKELEKEKQEAEPEKEKQEVEPAKLKNQLQAKAALERAVVAEFNRSERSSGQPTLEEDVANKERCVDQIRANLTVLIFGTSALLAMIISGYMKAGLLRTVGESGIPAWVDIAVTGLIVGADTKPLHDLISNISASKVEKQKPSSVVSSTRLPWLSFGRRPMTCGSHMSPCGALAWESKMSKLLALCCDGTWNTADQESGVVHAPQQWERPHCNDKRSREVE